MTVSELYTEAVDLLQKLVRVPSFSREEGATAEMLERWLREKLSVASADGCADEHTEGCTDGCAADHTDDCMAKVHRTGNNVWAKNLHFDPTKPTILLCSHHDTVRPTAGYTRDPFDGAIEGAMSEALEGVLEGALGGTIDEGRLWGLGSNDAGASVVSLAAAFRHFYERNDLKYNLLLALVAEEEISGPGGLRSVLPELGLGADCYDADDSTCPKSDDLTTCGHTKTGDVAVPSGFDADNFAIVGEPTKLNMAIAERGLMVLDCTAHGRSGHAARDEGENAIYLAIKDIEWFRTFRFPRTSPLFGDVKMSVTMISAGTAHNVVPAECRFTVDVRVNEQYTNEEVLSIVRQHVTCDVEPRSMHLRPSSISPDHPIVVAGKSLGITTFGSPTTSDQVVLDIPSAKIGPGDSARSHAADEYVELAEIKQGIDLYIRLLEKLV